LVRLPPFFLRWSRARHFFFPQKKLLRSGHRHSSSIGYLFYPTAVLPFFNAAQVFIYPRFPKRDLHDVSFFVCFLCATFFSFFTGLSSIPRPLLNQPFFPPIALLAVSTPPFSKACSAFSMTLLVEFGGTCFCFDPSHLAVLPAHAIPFAAPSGRGR